MEYTNKNKILIGFLVVLVLIGIVVFLFIINPLLNSGSAPSSSMKLSLSMSNAPALGETTEIIAKITPTFENSNKKRDTVATINLPEGFELVSGDITWEGELKP